MSRIGPTWKSWRSNISELTLAKPWDENFNSSSSNAFYRRHWSVMCFLFLTKFTFQKHQVVRCIYVYLGHLCRAQLHELRNCKGWDMVPAFSVLKMQEEKAGPMLILSSSDQCWDRNRVPWESCRNVKFESSMAHPHAGSLLSGWKCLSLAA